ncbi:MAG TPA: cys-tRNA(pro)/cys-tRNA(cys) deacylase, partial [Afipia sp.]|nr:cys-tRNA(pro)/cys-tRNA(cys) deacylase [Afipia sp.]
AAGSINSAVRISPARMAELTSAEWIDVSEIREQSEVA